MKKINQSYPFKTAKGTIIPVLLVVVFLVVALGLFAVFGFSILRPGPSPQPPISPTSPKFEGFIPFSSQQEFKEYVESSALASVGAWGLGSGIRTMDFAAEAPQAMVQTETGFAKSVESPASAPERLSRTNVQVLGIDEPDIVKTDGRQIYFSQEQTYRWIEPILMENNVEPKKPGLVPPLESQAATKVIKAFPPTDLKVLTSLAKPGNLLLSDDILVIFTSDTIYGYDISNPSQPQESWKIKYEDNNYLVSARAYADKIYLVTSQNIDRSNPCPIRPLATSGQAVEIACTNVYHPVNSVPVDVTYTALVINPNTGSVSQSLSFVGTSGTSIVYMSPNFLYITYSYSGDFTQFFSNFLIEESDLFPAWVSEKVRKLLDYDISAQSKLSELQVILSDYQNSLSNDDRLKLENELLNRQANYFDAHKRELEKTGLAKISLNDFKVQATGEVPGQPLNQFSLDEYQNHLRLATTIGSRFWLFGNSGESANDVYVLNNELKITGSIIDLGLTERIYSARFIENMGYLVTFRQTDPFYVLDLSNPQKPELKGELKIPGYSSYLHPIAANRILGVGKEANQVKISLFDVSNPANPKEAAKYTLSEYWSDILNTHHAFLADPKHQVFFLPGSNGGYVFSYASDQLQLKKAVSSLRARRALYLDDYLYIIGDDEIAVLDETSWERVGRLEL